MKYISDKNIFWIDFIQKGEKIFKEMPKESGEIFINYEKVQKLSRKSKKSFYQLVSRHKEFKIKSSLKNKFLSIDILFYLIETYLDKIERQENLIKKLRENIK